MIEADLNGLMFHPGHGGLCRRFLKLLVDSTLCRTKYPNVFAKEELEHNNDQLEIKTKLLRSTASELAQVIKENEKGQRELDFLNDKLDYLKRIEDLYRRTIEFLEKTMERKNYRLDQVRVKVLPNLVRYLANEDLTKIYSHDLKGLITEDCLKEFASTGQQSQGTATTFGLLKRQQSHHTETEYTDTFAKIQTTHQDVSKLLEGIFTEMSRLDYYQLEIKKTPNIEGDLVAFRLPECQEIVVEANKEETELLSMTDSLSKRADQLEREVIDLAQQYKLRRDEITKNCREELKRIRAKYLPPDLNASDKNK